MNVIKVGYAARGLYAEQYPGTAEDMLATVEFAAAGRIDSEVCGSFAFGLLGAAGAWVTANWGEITRRAEA